MKYDYKAIEKKWQDIWDAENTFAAKQDFSLPKYYALVEFPYPSGQGLHVGHPRSYTALDIVARKKRLCGYNVLYPMGWDAFGLPTENYAMKNHIHPEVVTANNVARFKSQLKSLGLSFDWTREINTTDPSYYKWTQWIFLQLYKKGLAYKKEMSVNWCTSCKVVLANEEVVGGVCERCGGEVVHRVKSQWMLKITAYADRLIDDLEDLDFIDRVVTQQKNWIGRSHGAEVKFSTTAGDELLIYTTRPDTLFGATYMVISPEHPCIEKWADKITNLDAVREYQEAAAKKSDFERTELAKDKVGGVCERCGGEVVHRVKSQWMLKITAYADRLIDDLEDLDFIDRVVTQQKNWIGRSHGAEVKFSTTAGDELLIYTTRPDTLFGATYMVISPEHPCIEKWADKITNLDAVREYQEAAAKKSDFERTELAKDKTGVRLEGVRAVNPVNGKEIPIFISDYVLISYGTGAIMAVPAHDERDYDFAKKFDLPIVEVVKGGDVTKEAFTDCATGVMVNSGFLDGMSVDEAKKAITEWLAEKGLGTPKTNFKLRDWVFSRQRYWGEPIPMVNCEKCGWVPLPESELPLVLPEIKDFEPTGDGESPLARHTEWVNTTCPCCGGPAKRETDTMPQWAGSSWYFLRYMDPHNNDALASREALEYWSPVDWYNGGMEHTTLHLLYSRFWHKFLYDIGVVPTREPYQKRTSHGMILGENGEKMSKSRGNVVNPDDIVRDYGADTMRLYEMFIGDFEKSAPWNTASIKGCRRFLERVWSLADILVDGDGYSAELEGAMHRTIKKVTEDIEVLKMNTAIAAMMSLLNEIYDKKSITRGEFKTLLILLNPFAPHITEELWQQCGYEGQLAHAKWPEFDEAKCVEDTVEIAVQVNGKLRAKLTVATGAAKEDAIAAAKAEPNVAKALEGKTICKEIYVPGKLVNIAVR